MGDQSVTQILTLAMALGLSAGFSPGPLLTLVVAETMEHSIYDGIKIALSPLATDLPIILATLYLFSKLPEQALLLGVISVLGGLYIAYLGVAAIGSKPFQYSGKNRVKSSSFKKGVVANFLSPSPYLFWGTMGAPTVIRAYEINIYSAALFLILFYLLLVGSKIIIACVVSKTKGYINEQLYTRIMKCLGGVLLIFALLFLYDGYEYISSML